MYRCTWKVTVCRRNGKMEKCTLAMSPKSMKVCDQDVCESMMNNLCATVSVSLSLSLTDSVDVLFDDGVEYTAPLRSVRKRVS